MLKIDKSGTWAQGASAYDVDNSTVVPVETVLTPQGARIQPKEIRKHFDPSFPNLYWVLVPTMTASGDLLSELFDDQPRQGVVDRWWKADGELDSQVEEQKEAAAAKPPAGFAGRAPFRPVLSSGKNPVAVAVSDRNYLKIRSSLDNGGNAPASETGPRYFFGEFGTWVELRSPSRPVGGEWRRITPQEVRSTMTVFVDGLVVTEWRNQRGPTATEWRPQTWGEVQAYLTSIS